VGTATYSLTVFPAEELAEDAQESVEDAPATSFDKAKDQAFIEDKFEDLTEALEAGDSNAKGKASSLKAQVSSKVTDEDLKAYLLDVLDRILDSLG
jgi:hypothetical protein